MKKVALEDLVAVVCSEFVKRNKEILQYKDVGQEPEANKRIPYLQMNFATRRKLAEKLLDELNPCD